MRVSVALNIPDCHIPWHDKKAYQIMLTCALDVNERTPITEINIMGDYADFLYFSNHPKLPEQMPIKIHLKDEIHCVIQKLEELRRLFPKARIKFIEGNHEYRMVRYLTKKAPELYDLFTLPDILRFKQNDIEYFPFGKQQLVQCLNTDYYLRHQPFNTGKHCAAGSLDAKHISIGFGHTHRKQEVVVTDAHGKELSGRSMGWLGDRLAPVFSYVDTDHWSQSFEFVYSEAKPMTYREVKNLNHSPQPATTWWADSVRIVDSKAYYNGVIYS